MVAYAHAPFVVVQPTLAVGLLLVLVLGIHLLGESVGLRELAGVVAILGGVALVAWGAPQHSDVHRSGIAVIAVVAALCAAGLAPFALRGTRLDTGTLAILAAGCGFAATNVATKLVGDDFDVGHAPSVIAWGAVVVVMGVVATLTNMTAFQRRAATVVVPVSTSVQTFLPIVLEPLFLREHWGSASHDGIPIAVGLALALAGNFLLAGTRVVSELIADAAELESSSLIGEDAVGAGGEERDGHGQDERRDKHGQTLDRCGAGAAPAIARLPVRQRCVRRGSRAAAARRRR